MAFKLSLIRLKRVTRVARGDAWRRCMTVSALIWSVVSVNPALAQNKDLPPVKDSTPAPVCRALDFRSLAYSINDEQAREKRAVEWLSRYGKDCPFAEIEAIRNNMAVWLGTASTEKVSQIVRDLYFTKKPLPPPPEGAKGNNAPVIKPSGSVDFKSNSATPDKSGTVETAERKIQRLPNKVDPKVAASAAFALRENEIAQCLPNEVATWGDGGPDGPMLSQRMLFVYDHKGAPASVSEESVFSVLQQAASAWQQCGGQNAVMLKRDVFANSEMVRISVLWTDLEKTGAIGLANLGNKTLALSPQSFVKLQKSNALQPIMETLQMVVSHEMGHFHGLMAHSKRCVDVLSYYSNDAGEACLIRNKGVLPRTFEYRALLPTACDLQRCRAANGF
mgnify:FL=1